MLARRAGGPRPAFDRRISGEPPSPDDIIHGSESQYGDSARIQSNYRAARTGLGRGARPATGVRDRPLLSGAGGRGPVALGRGPRHRPLATSARGPPRSRSPAARDPRGGGPLSSPNRRREGPRLAGASKAPRPPAGSPTCRSVLPRDAWDCDEAPAAERWPARGPRVQSAALPAALQGPAPPEGAPRELPGLGGAGRAPRGWGWGWGPEGSGNPGLEARGNRGQAGLAPAPAPGPPLPAPPSIRSRLSARPPPHPRGAAPGFRSAGGAAGPGREGRRGRGREGRATSAQGGRNAVHATPPPQFQGI